MMQGLPEKRFRIFAMLLLLLCMGEGWDVAHAQEHIVFREAVCVQGAEVTLGDLAVANGPESTIFLEHFAAHTLADAPPRQGDRKVISADMIREGLSRIAAAPGSCDIPFQIQVQRGGRVIDGPQIRKEVDKFLTRALASKQAEVNIRDYRLPDRIFVPDVAGTLAMDTSREIEPGRISFRINVLDGNRNVVKRISASVFLDAWVTVPCAARPLGRGRVIVPEAVRFERKNLAYLRGAVWNGRGGPWWVKRPMGTGEVVYDKNIELMPIIVQGARVSLVFDGPNIRLEVPAEALEDGRTGKSIMVRNLQSDKQILARVRDKNTVVVH
ncbi:flagellar basal body P-ring formation chaperone FlgA [Desulfoplanes sp. PS50]